MGAGKPFKPWTKNALYLKSAGACEIIKDQNARKDLIKKSFKLLNDKNKIKKLKKNILLLSKPDATKKIVDKLLDKIKRWQTLF